ncbi:MAG: hypothetical protein AB7P24_03690 [Nitrospira sp.]
MKLISECRWLHDTFAAVKDEYELLLPAEEYLESLARPDAF